MPPRWLVLLALVGNTAASFVFLFQRNTLLWLVFAGLAVINIHSLIKLGGRCSDPQEESTP